VGTWEQAEKFGIVTRDRNCTWYKQETRKADTVMINPNLNWGALSPHPNPLGRYIYSGSRRGIVFVIPNIEEMQIGVFGGLFKQGWSCASDQQIYEHRQSPIPSYPVQEPEPGQPAPPEPEPQPQRQPAVAPTPRRTAVAEPETEHEHETATTEDAAQEIARLWAPAEARRAETAQSQLRHSQPPSRNYELKAL
jgi:hypothetical protein